MKLLIDLLENYQSVVLGSIGENGYPFSSYAPCYYDGVNIYIFISDIATHSKNIKNTNKASAIFIEDEKQSENIFARKRISLQCDAKMILRDDSIFIPVMDAFQDKYEGGTLAMLMGMSDFNLYALTPIYGEATFGFGEAYNIGGENMNQLVPRTGDTGHNK